MQLSCLQEENGSMERTIFLVSGIFKLIKNRHCDDDVGGSGNLTDLCRKIADRHGLQPRDDGIL
jgi:hypothetical protein